MNEKSTIFCKWHILGTGLYQNPQPGPSSAYSCYNPPVGYPHDSQIRFGLEAPEAAVAASPHSMMQHSTRPYPYRPQPNYSYVSNGELALGFGNPLSVASRPSPQLYSPLYNSNELSTSITDDDLRTIKMPSASTTATMNKSYERSTKVIGTKPVSKTVQSAFKDSFDSSSRKNLNASLSKEFHAEMPGTSQIRISGLKKHEINSVPTKFIAVDSNKIPQEVVSSTASLRVLSGTVDKIVKWEKILSFANLLFEVFGSLVSVQPGMKYPQKVLMLREPTGPILQCIFYEIDRRLPSLQTGDYIRCVGWFIGKTKMQIVSVREVTPAERSSIQRLGFISQRAAQDIFDNYNKNENVQK
ncbi:spermatogenesis-associated protein 22 isoform X2 [Schistocerca gregaria]|uniref:spermatogenesis-associated protein 22 isoform X2 n=1 Tax=Schistocerca gregaria TaxID=7010 RepID=UPI00211DCC39|nr:spermatogenesis-associated protein 22 isoform X2 [Schistocerca gregaria]